MKKMKPKSLLGTSMHVDFEIGRTVKKIEEILKIRKGTVIKLEQSEKNVIKGYVNGVEFSTGKTLRKGGEIFIKIEGLEIRHKGGE
jgi:flagellar motor switch/type III secretory pathway protein FliN